MRKFLIAIICILAVVPVFAAGENVATSKAFVDTAVAQKQDKIPANSGTAQVLTNTGESGTVGTKEIYDSSAAYNGQMDSLVDAATMNAAVQNAIDAEFRCIKWVDDDQTKDCLLVEIWQNLLGTPAREYGASFDTQTHVMTNATADTSGYINLYIFLHHPLHASDDPEDYAWLYSGYPAAGNPRTIRFSSSDYEYLYIKHNGGSRDHRLFWALEPNTNYVLTFNVLSNNPTVVGGMKIYLELRRDNYLPSGN